MGSLSSNDLRVVELVLKGLNDEQRRAVTAPDGPVMIVAGPGTGKTKTLVARIRYLVESGRARPEEVLALTFTAKAAAEMRERLAGSADGVRVATFHAVGLEQLGADGREFVGESERMSVIRGLKKPDGLAGLSSRELALRLSRAKNAVTEADAAVAQLAVEYDRELAARNKRDFDDVLVAWHERMEQASGRGAWRYVLIDEFQDTSEVQYAIARGLAPSGGLFVIGDPRQSIYGFRGAGARCFARFAEDYPEHLAVTLQVNYRSGGAIVALANQVFADEGELVAHAAEAGQVRVVETLADYSEAEYVVGEIERALGGTDLARVDGTQVGGACRFRDVAVVYRTHRAARALVRRLAASGLPYQVAGGEGPYGSAPVRLVVAAVRVAGGEDAAVVAEAAGARAAELEALAAGLPEGAGPSEVAAKAADRLGSLGEDDRLAVAQLTGALVRFDGRSEGLAEAARYLAGLEGAEFYDPAADAITLLTIHAAKGLEFPVVFVIGAHDGGLPHVRGDGSGDMDEERRLFYVAATRAKQRLELVWARERDGRRVGPSRFLEGLDVARVADPAMARLVRKRTVARAKRSQGSLF